MILRLTLLLSLFLPLAGHGRSAIREDALVYRDVIGQAAMRLAHAPNRSVLAWLRRRPGILSASIGTDGRTVDIRFADGTEGAILPAFPVASRMSPPRRAPSLRPHLQAVTARALVLEPFADELGLGQDEGGAEAASLRSAGFAVDQAYNEQADMRLMQSLPAYSVVYMLTHSGVNAEGEGVIATGQVANPDPSVQPLLDDRTVMVVGVVGTSQKYYGILSGYFMRHSSAFPAGSLWFVNGCSMLRASLVWNALAYRGVRAMVSWDNEAMANDDATAAQIFYQSLAAGRTVSQSLGDVFAAGHGRSLVGVTTAQLGYLGDAGFTLHDVQFPPPPTSTAPPTATSTPVPAAPPASPTPSPHLRHPWPAPLPWKTAVRLRPS